MSRRRLFTDRHALARGVRAMVSSLFHRRRIAPAGRNGASRRADLPVRRGKRKSVADRVRGWMGKAAESAAGAGGSGALTLRSHVPSLATPESLETRVLLAVTANASSATDTLAIYMTADNDHAYVQQIGDGAGARLQVSSAPDFAAASIVYNGPVPANLFVYDGANISVSGTPATNGGGYTTAPAVTVQDTTFGTPLGISSTLKATGFSSFGGTGFNPSSTYTITGTGAGSTSGVQVSITTDAAGAIIGSSILASGANFSTLAPGSLSWSGAKIGTFSGSLTGSVDSFYGSSGGGLSGSGYYRRPQITVAGGASGTASVTLSGDTGAWLNTGFTSLGATPLSSNVSIGDFYSAGDVQSTSGSTATVIGQGAGSPTPWRYDGVETIVFKAGSVAAVQAVMADTIDVQGNIAAPTQAVDLTTAAVLGQVNIGASISAQQLGIASGGAGLVDLIVTGSIVTSGSISIDRANSVVIGSPVTAGTTFYGVATNDITLSAPVSTGTGTGSWVLLRSTAGTLTLDANLTSTQGTLTLEAQKFAGAAVVTGRSLTIDEGGGAGNYTLNANVTNLAGETASNLTFKNAGNLTIGQGALTLSGAANTLALESTGGSLNVVANIVMAGAAGIVSLAAKNNINITGTILPSGNPLDLTLTSSQGNIAATSALQLGSGKLIASANTGISIPNLTAASINVTTAGGNLTVTETDGVTVDRATVTGTGNLTVTTLNGDINLATDATVGIIGSGGTATLQSNKGSIAVNGTLTTQSTGSFVLNAANGTITNTADGSLATGTLNWIATSGVQDLLNTPAVSKFSKLAANITGASNPLQVETGSDLELTTVSTKSGDITVSVSNATSRANISITGNVTAGNTLADANRQNITLSATNGSITSTGTVTGNVLTLTAANSSNLQNQNILQLNATITGPGQNLDVTAASGLKTGDISVDDGNVNLSVTSGNLTRSGSISAGDNGTVNLSVPSGRILGASTITTETLRFSATSMPDLAAATFTKLAATLTSSGDIDIDRSGDLTLETANASFGNVKVKLSTGNLTINGPINANGPSNISLNIVAGGVTLVGSSTLTANILNVSTANDIVLNTNVDTLIANVTGASGNITIVETNGLTIGGDNVQAANDISITVTAGDLVRTGQVKSTGSGNVTLNVPAGAITGTGQVTAGNLSWTSKASADINGASGLTFTNLAASVTGTGNTLAITGTSSANVKITSASTAGGDLTITAGAGKDIVIDGPVSAGAGDVTLTAVGGSITSNTTDRIVGDHLTVSALNDVSLNTTVTSVSADVTGAAKKFTIDESNGLAVLATGVINAAGNVTLSVGTQATGGLTAVSGSAINSGDSVNIVANALGFGGAVTIAGLVTATNNLSLFANGTSTVNADVASITANVTGGGLTVTEADDLSILASNVTAAGPISVTSTAGNITGSGVINAGSGNAVTLSAVLGNVTLTAANAVVGSTLTVAAQNDTSIQSNVTTLVASIASGNLTLNEATDLVIGAGNVSATGDIALNLTAGSLTGGGSINAGDDVSINAAAGGINVTGKIVADVLTIDTARGAVNLTTNVSELTVNATGFGNGITVAQTGDLEVGAAHITANDAAIVISATGNITGTGNVNAGVGDVSLTSSLGNVTLNQSAGQVRGELLTLSAVNASNLETNVTSLIATISGDLQSLTLNEASAISISGVTTNNGAFDLKVNSGDIDGAGVLSTGAAGIGNVSLDAVAGGVTLDAVANQVVANVLTVEAQNAIDLRTKINQLTSNISNPGDGLTIVEANGLLIAIGAVQTDDGDISIQAASIGGAGAIQAGDGAIALNTTGAITLDASAPQVSGGDLAIIAGATSSLKTAVDNLAATVTGALTIVEADALDVDTGDITATGAISITAGGSIAGSNSIDAGASGVTLNAAGAVTFNSTQDQVVAGVLNVITTAPGDVDLNTRATTLIANVNKGDLTVVEASGLAIGVGNVTADGAVLITLEDGSLTGTGQINATGVVNLTLGGTGDIALNSAVNQVSGTTLTIDVVDGKVAANTKVANLNATASGNVTIVEGNDLVVDAISATDAIVKVTLTTGDLTIDTTGISAGQVGDVSLNAAAGAINSTGGGTVFANVLTVNAQNSSQINTSITTIAATITADGESLAIDESDATDPTPDGLSIATIVTSNGDVTLNVASGNLGGLGSINTLNATTGDLGNVTLNVPNGAATLNFLPGQIVANELAVSVYRSTRLNTNVAALNQVAALDSIIGVANVSSITASAATDVITAAGHAFVNGDSVQLRNLAGGTGLANDTTYFVVNASQANGTLQLSTVLGGAAINLTTDVASGSIHATQLLTITEVDDLEIAGAVVAENDADITITVGGNLTYSAGQVNSASGNVTLTAATGSIGDLATPMNVGAASGLLTITARDNSFFDTTIDSITANVTAGALDVDETGDLEIAAGNVRATGGVSLKSSGNIAGNGTVTATSNNVTLNSTGGAVLLNAVAGQIVGNVLNLVADGESFANTNVTSLTANITGATQNLTVVESNGLVLDATGGVKTSGGDVTIKLTQGSLSGSETVNAGAGDVALNVLVGGVNLTGQVSGTLLDVRSVQAATLGSTNVTELSANIAAGSLTVTELNDLDVAAGGVRAFSGVTMNVGNATTKGNLAGSGVINGGASTVRLNAVNGAVTLDDVSGQIVGGTLNLTAQNTSVVNTAIGSIVASIVDADDTLTVNELDSLTVATGNVVTSGGDVTINTGNATTGGNLSILGQINVSGTTPGDVFLTVNGAVTGVGSIVANEVTMSAVNSSALNVNVTAIDATVSRDGQSLTITSSKALSIDGGDVATTNGAIAISTTAGDLTITGGVLDAGAANVTLTAAGGITASAGQVVGNVLTVTATNSTTLNTAVTTLAANVTGASKTLTVTEEDSLAIGAGGLRTSNGTISVEVAAGGLTLANPVNAGTADVTLKVVAGGIAGAAAGLVTGNVLTVNVAGESALFTAVNEVTGVASSGLLSINATGGLKIAAGNLNATGTAGLNLVATNGAINVAGKLNADTGAITLTTIRGDVVGAGNVTTAGNVTITSNGAVAINTSAGQLAANVLSVVASGNVAIKTDIAGLTASLNGVGRTLEIVDTGDFKIRGTGVSTNNANITLNAASGINVAADVSAGNRTLSLISSGGGFAGLGVLSATNLTLNAGGDVTVATKAANLAAVVSSGDLIVNQTGSLVVRTLTPTSGAAINGVSTAGGLLSLNVAGGSLSGNGAVNATSAGDVALNATGGAVTLNSAAGQVVGDLVALQAQSASVLNLAATTLAAKIIGAGESLSVSDTSDLALDSVTTAGGALVVNLAAGDLTGTGFVTVGAANVTLNVAGGVDLDSQVAQISANDLAIRSGGDTAVNTSVNTLSANVAGTDKSLTVNEFNGLALTTGDVVATGDVTIAVAAGNLTGTRAVTSAGNNVTLAVPAGSITLTSRTGQVSGELLNVTSRDTSSVNTNVANLTANIGGGGLAVVEMSGLNIAGTEGVNTASGGGNVNLTILNGNLGRVGGAINAGTGTVTLNVSRGNVALAAAANLVSAATLNVVSRGDAAINTAVGTIGNAAVTSTGSLTINEADDLTITRATAARNNVTVSSGAGSTLTVANISASLGTVNLSGIGNVVVGTPGIVASTLNITNANVSVSGGNLSARTVTQTNPVEWQITTLPTGTGSLGSVLNQVNNFNGSSLINVAVPTSLTLSAALPQIRQNLTLQGNGQLTLIRGSLASTAAGLTIANPGTTSTVTINGITLQSFGTGIDLRPGSKSTVTNVNVLSSTVGLQAAGSLTGSVVSQSLFDGQNRLGSTGAVLASAVGLTLGQDTSSYNTFRNVRDGLSATGTSTGTKVYGNRFETFARYGLSLVGVRGMEIGENGNLSRRNTIGSANAAAFGVFASGTSTGSSVNNMLFETSFQGTKYRVNQSSGLTINPPLS